MGVLPAPGCGQAGRGYRSGQAITRGVPGHAACGGEGPERPALFSEPPESRSGRAGRSARRTDGMVLAGGQEYKPS